MEVVQPKVDSFGHKVRESDGKEQLEVVNEIRFARWREGFATNFRPLFRNIDTDRFYIRMPHIAGVDIRCKIRSRGLARIQGGTGDQPFVEVAIEESPDYPDYLISEPLFLVSDVIDDTTYNGKNTEDNAKNDATYLASEESSIDIDIDIELGGDVKGKLVVEPKKSAGRVKVKLSYLSTLDQVPPHVSEAITKQFERTRDVFRQIGVEVVQDGQIEIIEANQTIRDIQEDGLSNSIEQQEFLNEVGRLYRRADIVHCIFTEYPITWGLGDEVGLWADYGTVA